MIGRSLRKVGWISAALLVVVSAAASVAAAPTAPLPSVEPARYVPPPPIRIYRFHVYSTLRSRRKNEVAIDSLVSTSSSGVAQGDRGVLERELDGSKGWAPIARIVVKKLLPNGRIEVRIEAEEDEARVKRHGKLPFAPGQKVRLQIDRVIPEGA